MPRPSSLKPEVHARLVGAVRAGLTIQVACQVAGVPPRTLYAWLERGAAQDTGDGRYGELRAGLARARAEACADPMARITLAAARGSWRAAAYLLETQFPERRAATGKSVVAQNR